MTADSIGVVSWGKQACTRDWNRLDNLIRRWGCSGNPRTSWTTSLTHSTAWRWFDIFYFIVSAVWSAKHNLESWKLSLKTEVLDWTVQPNRSYTHIHGATSLPIPSQPCFFLAVASSSGSWQIDWAAKCKRAVAPSKCYPQCTALPMMSLRFQFKLQSLAKQWHPEGGGKHTNMHIENEARKKVNNIDQHYSQNAYKILLLGQLIDMIMQCMYRWFILFKAVWAVICSDSVRVIKAASIPKPKINCI